MVRWLTALPRWRSTAPLITVLFSLATVALPPPSVNAARTAPFSTQAEAPTQAWYKPVPVSWRVHSPSVYFCIIITSKRSTLRRTSCYFWRSPSQLSSFTGPLASSYILEKVPSHVASRCACHGMPYWWHRSKYSTQDISRWGVKEAQQEEW